MLDLLVIVQWPGPPDRGPLSTHATDGGGGRGAAGSPAPNQVPRGQLCLPWGPRPSHLPSEPSREGRPAGLRSWALPDIRPLLS